MFQGDAEDPKICLPADSPSNGRPSSNPLAGRPRPGDNDTRNPARRQALTYEGGRPRPGAHGPSRRVHISGQAPAGSPDDAAAAVHVVTYWHDNENDGCA